MSKTPNLYLTCMAYPANVYNSGLTLAVWYLFHENSANLGVFVISKGQLKKHWQYKDFQPNRNFIHFWPISNKKATTYRMPNSSTYCNLKTLQPLIFVTERLGVSTQCNLRWFEFDIFKAEKKECFFEEGRSQNSLALALISSLKVAPWRSTRMGRRFKTWVSKT